jgi:hypothetical protein
MYECFPGPYPPQHTFTSIALQSIAKLPDDTLNNLALIQAESDWITKLDTVTPHGINSRKDKPNLLPLILKFSDSTYKIASTFKMYYLELIKKFPTIFRTQLITAHCRNKNLTDILTSSQIPGQPAHTKPK